MTPLAAKLFRIGSDQTQRELAASQFLECSALAAMALEMRRADPPGSGFSPNAFLPAPRTFIELAVRGRRVAFACQESEIDGRNSVVVNSMGEQKDGRITVAWQAAFTPGLDKLMIGDGTLPNAHKHEAIYAGLFLVEKLLCIINQPGLADLRTRDTDKRVMRLAVQRSVEAPRAKWHECFIQPGVHGTIGTSAKPKLREHQLHYVRKHLKPSLGPDRWIDGHWRGNADLGIYLKTYVGRGPNADAED